jgi:ParB family chromosome partitioning protein
MATEKLIKLATAELILLNWNDADGNRVEYKDDMDCVKFIKDCIPKLEPDDKFTPITVEVLKEYGYTPPMTEVIEEVEEVKEEPEMNLFEEISQADFKSLKLICQSEPQFKSIRGKLSSFKDEDDLRLAMFTILDPPPAPKVEEQLEMKKALDEAVANIPDKIIFGKKEEKVYDVFIGDIVTRYPFQGLFNIEAKVLNSIAESMVLKGYDKAYPLILWENIVIDGHTRLQAAKLAEFEFVPAIIKDFIDEQEALEYAMHNQRDRRNISEAELLNAISLIDTPMSKIDAGAKGGKATEEKIEPTHKKTAKTLGIGESKVADARAVLKDEEAVKEVKAGKKTISQAAKEVRKKKAKPRKEVVVKTMTRIESILQLLKDNAGNLMETMYVVEESDNLFLAHGGESNMVVNEGYVKTVLEVLQVLKLVKFESEDVFMVKKSLK